MFLLVLAISFSLFGGYDLDREWLLISATLILSGGRWARPDGTEWPLR
jgi:hypothetical protein